MSADLFRPARELLRDAEAALARGDGRRMMQLGFAASQHASTRGDDPYMPPALRAKYALSETEQERAMDIFGEGVGLVGEGELSQIMNQVNYELGLTGDGPNALRDRFSADGTPLRAAEAKQNIRRNMPAMAEISRQVLQDAEDSLKGRVVTIQGLQSKPELNGASAIYVEKVTETGRIRVRVTALANGAPPSNDMHIKLKPECVLLDDGAGAAAADVPSAASFEEKEKDVLSCLLACRDFGHAVQHSESVHLRVEYAQHLIHEAMSDPALQEAARASYGRYCPESPEDYLDLDIWMNVAKMRSDALRADTMRFARARRTVTPQLEGIVSAENFIAEGSTAEELAEYRAASANGLHAPGGPFSPQANAIRAAAHAERRGGSAVPPGAPSAATTAASVASASTASASGAELECSQCHRYQPKAAFSKNQLTKSHHRRCKECIHAPASNGNPAAPTAPASVGSLQTLAADCAVAAGASSSAVGAAGYPEAAVEQVKSAERRNYPEGTRVTLCGLQSKPTLNGTCGHILQYDEPSGRFCVGREVSGPGEQPAIRVKASNLEACAPSNLAVPQKLVDAASKLGAGSRVLLPKGEFQAGGVSGSLTIPCAMTIEGQGAAHTLLRCAVTVANDAAGPLLRLANLSVVGHSVEIGGMGLQRVHLHKLRVDMRRAVDQSDALVLNEIGGGYRSDKVLLEECEVVGGSDGIMIDAGGCTLRKCTVLHAQSRGIFANDSFTIEDSTVQGCGGYGMKTRAGCNRRGRNNIQAGPWDGHMAFGEDANPFGIPPPGGPPAFGFGGGFDGFGGGYGDEDEGAVGPHGFTHEEEMELMAQGVRPWDEDAHAVMAALNGEYDDEY